MKSAPTAGGFAIGALANHRGLATGCNSVLPTMLASPPSW